MPRGKLLTEREIGFILALHGEGKSNRKIAASVGRSEKAVRTLLSKKDGPKRTKKVGRRTLLKKRTVRRIFRLACVKQMSSRNIAAALDHVVKRTTVLRVLRASKFASYIKRKPTPHLKKHHKTRRMAFAKKHLNKVGFWERVLFTDEKKFNLDGPDGCQYYWHDIRKDPETYSKRVAGGGSVMVWAGVCLNGKTKIAFLEGKQTAVKYTQTLSDYLCPFLQELQDDHGLRDPIFQQDGASIHTAKATQAFLSILNVTTMEWPAKSPDLNIIENVWGVLARSVYAGGRQFTCREDLKKQIEVSWRQVSAGYLKTLVEDMPTRIAEVIIRGGAGIDR